MKKCKILFLAGLCALLARSCQTDELIKFAGGEAFVHIHRPRTDIENYFQYFRNIAATNPDLEFIIMYAPVRIAGDITDYDRPIAFELTTPNLTDYYEYGYTLVRDEYGYPVYDEYGNWKLKEYRFEWQEGRGASRPLMVEGRDIELLPSYIRYGRNYGYIRVRINNTQLIRDSVAVAVITLNENEHFRNDLLFRDTQGNTHWDQRLRFYFLATNTSEEPRLWAANPGNSFTNTVGAFSIAKYHLMMRVIGFDDTLLNYIREDESYTTALTRTVGGLGGLFIMARAILVYLTEYYERTGSWMLDEHGYQIRMHHSIVL
jgi:hypothetical protein